MIGTYGDGLTQATTNADPVNQTIGFRGINGAVGTLAYGNILDGVTAAGFGIQKTKSYGVQAGFEHYWVPDRLRTSLYGSYNAIDYNGTANALLCGAAQREPLRCRQRRTATSTSASRRLVRVRSGPQLLVSTSRQKFSTRTSTCRSPARSPTPLLAQVLSQLAQPTL